jgi:hypothetical protein
MATAMVLRTSTFPPLQLPAGYRGGWGCDPTGHSASLARNEPGADLEARQALVNLAAISEALSSELAGAEAVVLGDPGPASHSAPPALAC